MEPLIGREKETTAILKWLEFQDSPVQVVSIVGGPGVGKSAIAVAVGHKLIQQGVAVCYVDMYNASERNMKQFQISKHLDELASQVRRPTLLILDNCDHYIHTQRKEFQNLALSQKYRFVKVLITSQVRIQVAFSGHGFEEYHLQKLDKDQLKPCCSRVLKDSLHLLQAIFVFTLTWNSCFKNKRRPIDVQKFWMRTVTSLGLSFMVLALNLMSLMKRKFCKLWKLFCHL